MGFALAFLAGLIWFASHGLPQDAMPGDGIVAAVWSLLAGGGLAAVYLLGAIGWGRPLVAVLLPGSGPSRPWLQAGLGLGFMLTLSHALGIAGLLGAGVGPIIAWGTTLVGGAILVDQVVRGELRPERWSVLPGWAILAAPALALMLVAASSPPGALWLSEAHGYDVLSYHLQLPKEWLEAGRIRPLEHNVYSFLPSHMEAAFTHLGAMLLPAGPAGASPGAAYISGAGAALLAAQMLHALVAILAAALIGRLGWAMLLAGGVGAITARYAGTLAAAAVLATPWTIVVGSMAYNEMAVVALGAAAALAAVERGERHTPVRRAVAAGLLVGMACGAKPTAAFTVGPVVGLLLLGFVHPDEAPSLGRRLRVWAAMAGAGALAGLAPMLPWMVRNAAASGGNPVFPFAARLLGRGHWSEEQVARYAGAHHAHGAWAERFTLLLSSDRGITHEQWSVMVFAGLVGLIAAVAWRRTRRAALLLLAGTVVVAAAWMALTHMQSRFLIPALLPLGAGVGLGAAALISLVARLVGEGGARRRHAFALTAAAVCAALPAALTIRAVNIFAVQRGQMPNALLPMGVEGCTGLPLVPLVVGAGNWDREQELRRAPTPQWFLNLFLPIVAAEWAENDHARIYLLGDATPLYYAGDVLYHTTWDRSPLGALLAKYPGRPQEEAGAQWARGLRAQGVRWIVINLAELHRLIEQDNWYDRDVTVGMVTLWAQRWCRLIRAWPETGQYLFELPDPDAAPPGGAEPPTPPAEENR